MENIIQMLENIFNREKKYRNFKDELKEYRKLIKKLKKKAESIEASNKGCLFPVIKKRREMLLTESGEDSILLFIEKSG